MPETRKRHSAEFKATVAVEAIKGIKTTAELASEFQVHPAQISQWKRHAVDGLPGLFQGPNTTAKLSIETIAGPLYEQIGRLKVELRLAEKKAERVG